jgi:hypothetical protein
MDSNETGYAKKEEIEKKMTGIETTIVLKTPFDRLRKSHIYILKNDKEDACVFRGHITKELMGFLNRNKISVTESVENGRKKHTIIGGVKIMFIDDLTIQYTSTDESTAKTNYQNVMKELRENNYEKAGRNCKQLFESENELHCQKTLGIEDAWTKCISIDN